MGIEVERKFRVADEAWRAQVVGESVAIRQFYLAIRDGLSARLRVVDGRRATLTIKTGLGVSRGEFEYDVPVEDALALEESRLGAVIEKRRFEVPLGMGGLLAEVDVYEGALAPLIVAEVELPHEGSELVVPDWFGPEVTGDPRYLNAGLAQAGSAPSMPVLPFEGGGA